MQKPELPRPLPLVQKLPLLIRRRLQDGDIPGLLQLDGLCFDETWTEQEFKPRAMRICQVAFYGSILAGFIVYAIGNGCYHVLRVGVDTRFRRQGVASRLIKDLINETASTTFVYVDLCERDLVSQLLFRANQFKWIKTRKSRSPEVPAVYRLRYSHPSTV